MNGSLQSEIMAFCFSIAARIERDLMIAGRARQRTGYGEGHIRFGRPPGPGKSKLDPYKEEIAALLRTGSTQRYLARKFKCAPAA